MNRPHVSVIVPLHHEGRLFNRTKRSIEAGAVYAQEHGINVEVILVMDRPSDDTVRFVRDHPLSKNIDYTVKQVDFGNPGLTRNFGVSIARGRYIAFIDGDNLLSPNWLTVAVGMMRDHKEDIVVHPQYVVVFGVRQYVWRTISSVSKEFDPYSLAEHNHWDTVCVTSKRLLLQVPHDTARPSEGFGYEDWHWNCETLARGVEHYVAPGTAFFYRTKGKNSMLSVYDVQATLIPPTDFLTPEGVDAYQTARRRPLHPNIKQPEVTNEVVDAKPPLRKPVLSAVLWTSRKSGRLAYKAVFKPATRIHSRIRKFEAHLYTLLQELVKAPRFTTPEPPAVIEPPEKEIPKWLIEEWRAAHEFEPELFPAKEALKFIPEHKVSANIMTDLYWSIARSIESDNDYLIMVPWLQKGGADLEVLNYVRGVRQLHPKAKITVLATTGAPSPWKKFLPKDVRFVELDQRLYTVSPAQQTLLMGNVLLQLAPKKIHVINSPIGYQVLAEHAQALSTRSKLFLLIFCLDHTNEGQKVHYVIDYLDDSIDYISRVFADNQQVVNTLLETYAYDKDKFSVHYQPFPGKLGALRAGKKLPKKFSSKRPLRILWAGRLDTQKRPDILIKIAKQAQAQKIPIEFHVYGSALLSSNKYLRAIKKPDISTIVYHGAFDKGLETLPLNSYDAFLMTSEWEGMPNVMLEATAGGLPIIAPAVGGIAEFIQSKKTGLLIDDYQDVESYLAAMTDFMASPEQGQVYVKNAQNLLKKRHNWTQFIETLKTEKEYTEL